MTKRSDNFYMKYNPIEDGVTHLNAFSRAETEIGRFLSNFAYCPIETEDGHFDSMEGYWGWLSISESNPHREEFRTLSGLPAKKLKDDLYREGDKGRFEPDFAGKIERAMHLKFATPMAKEIMEKNLDKLQLPLVHYYTYGDSFHQKIVDVTDKYPEFVNNVKKEINLFLNQKESLFGITRGVICQQVNCQAVMGAGLAKAIMDKYPIVYENYKDSFRRHKREELFGKVSLVKLSEDLYVANLYTQFSYGNPKKTGKVYTDADKLVAAVRGVCIKMKDFPVYLPHTKGLEGKENYGIGCGYGGETWEHLEPLFKALGMPNLKLIDTIKQEVHDFSSDVIGEFIFEKYEHASFKYPMCKGMSEVGQKMEQYQADIAAKFEYKPLPTSEKNESLSLYLDNLPSCFVSKNKREVKGGFELQGKVQPIFLKNGTKIANGYDRIVVGNYGAFVEIGEDKIVKDKFTTKIGEEYRETEKYAGRVKYFWKTVGDTEAKIYEQRQGVDYADYKAGKYYISPYEVMGKEEVQKMGEKWNDEFLPLDVAKDIPQRSIHIDPSLYEGKAIAFDMETTGLSAEKGDEPIQISIVNEDEQVIFSTYLKPYFKKAWPDAERINHISPYMVANAPHLDEYSVALQEIFRKASRIVGYNVNFDIRFVEKYGCLSIQKGKVFDTCSYFKKDVPSMKHTLSDAIDYYCPSVKEDYEPGAHDALVDTIATVRVYNAIQEKEQSIDVER